MVENQAAWGNFRTRLWSCRCNRATIGDSWFIVGGGNGSTDCLELRTAFNSLTYEELSAKTMLVKEFDLETILG
ncbi:unnamed protein product [Cuscuta campestris]|uniref:Uncharacterized protein n=1 Tax=Cuscuta campestris TaxID=132261 RepID=A0A484NJ93_9ASTE|nr:unnamed protein product [Cuscuta campestris]